MSREGDFCCQISVFSLSPSVHKQHMGEHGGVIVNIIADMFRGFPMMAHTGAGPVAFKASGQVLGPSEIPIHANIIR